MSEVVLKDHSIHEPSQAHVHPLETIPQGTQADGVLNGHDHRDVDTGILAKCFLGLVALIIFSFVVVWFVTIGMLDALARNETVPSNTYIERPALVSSWPTPPIDTRLDPPQGMPVLQPDPELPNVELREADEARLENYNWAKDDKGRTTGVTVPIDRAMELTRERGLPSDNRTQVAIQKPSGEPVEMGEIPFSYRYLRDQERAKNGVKAGAGAENPKASMHSREINPPTATTGGAIDKVDADNRNLGTKRSPF